ncbi:MAG: peptidylprolyl isomerase [Actinomycetota bacterium]|nr:peptidylprolyl isomerase [Actinomycetota bacterium]
MLRPTAALVAPLAVALVLAGCGTDKSKKPGKSAATTATTQSAPSTRATAPPVGSGPTTCLRVPKPKPKPTQRLPKPTLTLSPSHAWTAVLETSCGNIAIALDVKQAPRTAASFAYLARRGFYDGLTFHRIVPGFVVQGGDPQGTGQGGPGYSVVEAPPRSTRYTRGVVAMAKTEIEDPGTSGSQFFIVTGPDAQLPPDYAVVGKVSSGLDAVDRIATEPTDQGNPDPARREQPASPVVIRRVTIAESR